MITFNHKQGSPEWHAWRKGKIGASDIPIIMGKSPYLTQYQLWEIQCGLAPPQEVKPHMLKGHELEQQARDWYASKYNQTFEPACVASEVFPRFIASLDGLFISNNIHIMEIKYNDMLTHENVRLGYIRDMHIMQMNWQMMVCGVDMCIYISTRNGENLKLTVMRDQSLIDKMIVYATEHLECVDTLTAPALSERDYIDNSDDPILNDIAQRYKYYLNMSKEYQEKAEHLKDQLLFDSGSQNCKGKGYKITKYCRKGSVEYSKIPELEDVDLEQYRKPLTTAFRVTLE